MTIFSSKGQRSGLALRNSRQTAAQYVGTGPTSFLVAYRLTKRSRERALVNGYQQSVLTGRLTDVVGHGRNSRVAVPVSWDLYVVDVGRQLVVRRRSVGRWWFGVEVLPVGARRHVLLLLLCWLVGDRPYDGWWRWRVM